MRSMPQIPADLVTFAEEILNGKLHFLCSDSKNDSWFHKPSENANPHPGGYFYFTFFINFVYIILFNIGKLK